MSRRFTNSNSESGLALPFLSSLCLLTSSAFSQIQEGGFFGFFHFPHQQVPSHYGAGYSQYSAVWEFCNFHPQGQTQAGLPHNWMSVLEPPGYPKAPSNNGLQYYSTIEGGLGFWRDIRFDEDNITPKFKMGGVARQFSAIADGPGWGPGDWNDPRTGKLSIAQLSNRLVYPPRRPQSCPKHPRRFLWLRIHESSPSRPKPNHSRSQCLNRRQLLDPLCQFHQLQGASRFLSSTSLLCSRHRQP